MSLSDDNGWVELSADSDSEPDAHSAATTPTAQEAVVSQDDTKSQDLKHKDESNEPEASLPVNKTPPYVDNGPAGYVAPMNRAHAEYVTKMNQYRVPMPPIPITDARLLKQAPNSPMQPLDAVDRNQISGKYSTSVPHPGPFPPLNISQATPMPPFNISQAVPMPPPNISQAIPMPPPNLQQMKSMPLPMLPRGGDPISAEAKRARALQDYSFQLMLLERENKKKKAQEALSKQSPGGEVINDNTDTSPVLDNTPRPMSPEKLKLLRAEAFGKEPIDDGPQTPATKQEPDMPFKPFTLSRTMRHSLRAVTNPNGETVYKCVSEQVPSKEQDTVTKDVDPANFCGFKLDTNEDEIAVAFEGKAAEPLSGTKPVNDKPPPGPNRALQDHQMQLMLLEQQNRKRLLMARQEQVPATTNASTVSDNVPLPDNRAYADYEMQLMLLEQQNKKRLLMARQEQDMVAAGTSGKELQPSSSITRPIARGAEALPPGFKMFYRIVCAHPVHDLSGRVFTEAPELQAFEASGTEPAGQHFHSTHVWTDLDHFMKTSGMCAVVVRTAKCPGAPKNKAPRPEHWCGNARMYDNYYSSDEEYYSSDNSRPRRAKGAVPEWKESLHFTSHFIESTMKHLAKCHFEQKSKPLRRTKTRGVEENQEYQKNRVYPESLFLFHHREELRAQLLVESDHRKKRNISCLLQYTEMRYGEEFAEADALFARGQVNRKHASKLFLPNEVVVRQVSGQPVPYVLQEWPDSSRSPRYHYAFESPVKQRIDLTAWSFQSDGISYVRASENMDCEGFEDLPTPITKLSVYPMRFATDKQRTLIESRAKKTQGLGKTSQITYTGWTAGKERYFSDTKFMIDPTCMQAQHYSFDPLDPGQCIPAPPVFFGSRHEPRPFDTWPMKLDFDEEFSDRDRLLIQPKFSAFSLDESKWFTLMVDGVHSAQEPKKTLGQLVLPNKTKDLINDLVAIYTSPKLNQQLKDQQSTEMQRMVLGSNGNSLLMLFHGPPGTGKTFAAKSVAEAAGVPLYRVPCTDLQSVSHHHPGHGHLTPMEACIKDAIELGQKWKGVLLLDDADFFLGQRCAEGKRTSPPASNLLHKLQNYNGVVILTTSFIDAFTDSFISRMQVVLHFEELDSPARDKIWRNAINKLKESGVAGEWETIESEVFGFAQKEMNGHQIHHVLTTARQLAHHRGEVLAMKHLEQAVSISMNLNDRSTHYMHLGYDGRMRVRSGEAIKGRKISGKVVGRGAWVS